MTLGGVGADVKQKWSLTRKKQQGSALRLVVNRLVVQQPPHPATLSHTTDSFITPPSKQFKQHKLKIRYQN